MRDPDNTAAVAETAQTRSGYRESRVCAVLIGALVASTQWNAVRITHGLALVDVLMVLAFCAVTVDALVHRRSVRLPPALLAAAFGLAIVGLIAELFPAPVSLTANPVANQLIAQAGGIAVKSRSNLSSLVKFEAALIVLPVLFALTATTRRTTLRLLDCWAIGAIISAAAATTDLIGVTHISQSLLRLSTLGREGGLTLEPNHLALGASLALPLVMTWLTRSKGWRIGAVIGIGFLIVGIYATRSRGAEVAMPVNLLVGCLVDPRLRRRFVAGAPLIGMLAVITLLVSSGGLHSVLYSARLTSNASGVAASDAQRSNVRIYSVRALEARPIAGVGYVVIDDAHNIYIQLLASGGIIGLASFCLLIGSAAGMIRRLWHSSDAITAAALAASLATWLALGAIENQVTDRYLYVPIAGLVTLMSLQMSVRRRPAVLVAPQIAVIAVIAERGR